MKSLEDDSPILSYLDDTLDPAARAEFEVAMEADAELSREVRGLAAVREALGALPRPMAPRDLSGPVLAAIAAQSNAPRWLRFAERSRLGKLVVYASAAALLVAAALALSLPQQRANHQGMVVWNPAFPGPIDLPADPPIVPAANPSIIEPAPTPEVASADPFALPDADQRLDDERAELNHLLIRPEVQRVVVRVEHLDAARDRLDVLIQGHPIDVSARKLVRLPAGTGADPDCPGASLVYALEGDRAGTGQFSRAVVAAFPVGRATVETEPTPGVILALGEAIDVAPLSGPAAQPLADPVLRPPHVHDAIEGRVGDPARIIEAPRPGDGFGGDQLVGGVRVRPHAVVPPDRPPDAATSPAAPEPTPVTLLIWLTVGGE